MSLQQRVGPDRLLRGGVAGTVAFLAGYALTYAWKASTVNDALRGVNFVADLLGTTTIPTWKAVAWLFYGQHYVQTTHPTIGGRGMLNLVQQSNDTTVLLLIPPLLLVLAGAIVVAIEEREELGSAALGGALVVAGYAPLAIAGAFVTAHEMGDAGTVAPDPVGAILVAGLLYPIVFGGIGGAIAQRL